MGRFPLFSTRKTRDRTILGHEEQIKNSDYYLDKDDSYYWFSGCPSSYYAHYYSIPSLKGTSPFCIFKTYASIFLKSCGCDLKYFDSIPQEELQIVRTDNDKFKKFARYNGHIYFKGELIEGADPQTFNGIFQDSGIWEINDLSKDRNNLYIGNRVLKNIDPKTIELIPRFFLKDMNNVYLIVYGMVNIKRYNKSNLINSYLINNSEFITISTINDLEYPAEPRFMPISIAEPTTFNASHSPVYFYDLNYIYYIMYNSTVTTITASPIDYESIEVLDNVYAKDKSKFFFLGVEFENVDSENYLIKDDFLFLGDKVYYNDARSYFPSEIVLLQNAHPDTFEILNAYYAKDNSVVYFRSAGKIEKLENADTITFKVLDDISQRMVNYDRMGNNDASDKNNYYYRGKKLDPR